MASYIRIIYSIAFLCLSSCAHITPSQDRIPAQVSEAGQEKLFELEIDFLSDKEFLQDLKNLGLESYLTEGKDEINFVPTLHSHSLYKLYIDSKTVAAPASLAVNYNATTNTSNIVLEIKDSHIHSKAIRVWESLIQSHFEYFDTLESNYTIEYLYNISQKGEEAQEIFYRSMFKSIEEVKTANPDDSLIELFYKFYSKKYTDAKITRKNYLKNIKSIVETKRALMTELERAPLKLDDLIANNDRKGVVNLIETFLPWESMHPSEKAYWKTWLMGMLQKPDPKNSVLMFRGLGDGQLKSKGTANYLMSNLLTKNQGNYTRRLRSMSTVRDREFSRNEYAPLTSIMFSQFQSHSDDPIGSPYLSASNLDTAKFYSETGTGGKTVALQLHPDRFIESVSSRVYEYERLIPLIVFPDEIVEILSREEDFDPIDLRNKISKKLGRNLNESDLSVLSISTFPDNKDFLTTGQLKGWAILKKYSAQNKIKLTCTSSLKELLN